MKRKRLGMTVTLSSVGNPDHGQYYGKNVLSPTLRVEVKNLREASKVCRAYITRYWLGGGNWTGGLIQQGNRVLGRVSYSGLVWPPGKWHSGMRPLFCPEQPVD